MLLDFPVKDLLKVFRLSKAEDRRVLTKDISLAIAGRQLNFIFLAATVLRNFDLFLNTAFEWCHRFLWITRSELVWTAH